MIVDQVNIANIITRCQQIARNVLRVNILKYLGQHLVQIAVETHLQVKKALQRVKSVWGLHGRKI